MPVNIIWYNNEDMSSRVNQVIPDYISKNSNNKYVLSNVEHGVNNTEVLINDAGSLKDVEQIYMWKRYWRDWSK